MYCKFGNFRDNSIFMNSVKRHICDFQNSRLMHDLPISINDRVILPFNKGFMRSFAKIKPSWKFPNLQYMGQHIIATDFPRPDLGPNIVPFNSKISKNGAYHSQFLRSTFWWKFHESLNKNSKVTDIYEFMKHVFHSHFYANFHFYEGHLKYSFILLISYGFKFS